MTIKTARKVQIVNIRNRGKAGEELVSLKVEEDCDIGAYLLADTTYSSGGKVSSKLRHLYWFPDHLVKKGDFVLLYTGTGTNRVFKNTLGSTTHAFYWQLKVPVWNDDGDVAALIEARDWQFKGVK
ncbi:hypothetical protein [Solimonas sp. SE-A11]|uniref:hypothetical protein n=1 Tax=Solimonas sp. SE-A11 TaxID=3054954 RepID=UPI00259D0B2F|nr:hypothetical protein [Solimonas sp. SE-A11]MDM4771172.1 hypothetical protein [Solimonas sp. SE-A11]